jgi:hypothetical protein
MSDEILNRIEKHMEGTQLGLAALSEVLQKMDARIENEAEVSYEIAKEEQEQLEKEYLVRDIAKAVLIELADNPLGMDVDGEKVETVGGGDPTKGATATPNYVGDSDDSSETVTPRTKIEEQQATIQAEEHDDEDGDEDDEKEKAYMKEKAGDEEDDDEGSEEYPKKEKADDDDEDDEDEEVENLQKQLVALQKQIESLDISKAVREESENRLRKMGFKEENGLQKPQLMTNPTFGADETPIKKAQTVNDVVDQLTTLSYKELRKMQELKRQGVTENLPDEIANL